jgi:GTPase SAR1 family protein
MTAMYPASHQTHTSALHLIGMESSSDVKREISHTSRVDESRLDVDRCSSEDDSENRTTASESERSYLDLAWKIIASTMSILPAYSFAAECLPNLRHLHTPTSSPLLTRNASPLLSPYDSFNGSHQYVVTLLGPSSSGKSTLCQQLKKNLVDITQKRLFRYSPMPPELQISLPVGDDAFTIGLYDSVGFKDPELLRYLLKGQKIEQTTPDQKLSDSNSVSSPPPKKKKRIDSEGFIVLFDLSSLQSFEVACTLVTAIFDFFHFEPTTMTECPAVIYLVGNKKDLPSQVPTHRLTQFLAQTKGFVYYHEMSAAKDESVLPLMKALSLKIKEQRVSYQIKTEQTKRPTFWD